MSEASTVPLERWSPVDALRIVISAVLLVVILLVDRLFGDDLVSFISDVLAGFRTIDEDVVPAVAVVARIATLGVLGVGVVVGHHPGPLAVPGHRGGGCRPRGRARDPDR